MVRPAMLVSGSNQPLSHTTVSSEFSQLARSRNATACAAIPAASRVISIVVVVNSAFGGMRIKPK